MAAYSVLMPVYQRETPAYFKTALQSMMNQSIAPDEIVVVCDGPLTQGLEGVLSWARDILEDRLTIVRIPQNVGLGSALNIGLQKCQNELIARMDSDDVSLENRCELQLKAFSENPDVSIMSGTAEEFVEDMNTVSASRILPEKHEDIFKFSKSRNPFNHPCVMFKKSAVEKAGGYQPMPFLEDYYLWIRMLLNGEKGMNLQTPLIRMRTGAGMYKRRGGVRYALSEIRLFGYMKNAGMITGAEFCKSVAVRTLGRIAPAKLRSYLYKKLLRK